MGDTDLISAQVLELRGLAYLHEERGKGGRWTKGAGLGWHPGEPHPGFQQFHKGEEAPGLNRRSVRDALAKAAAEKMGRGATEPKAAAFWRLPAHQDMMRTWRKGDKVVTGQGQVGTVTSIKGDFARLDADDGYRYIVDWKHAGKVINAVRLSQATPEPKEPPAPPKPLPWNAWTAGGMLARRPGDIKVGDIAVGPNGTRGIVAAKAGMVLAIDGADGQRHMVNRKDGQEIRAIPREDIGPAGQPFVNPNRKADIDALRAGNPERAVAAAAKRKKATGGTKLGSNSPEVAKLADLAASGQMDRGTATYPHQGQQGETAIVTMPDGFKVIRKVQHSTKRNDAEELASYVSNALGAGAPAIARDPRDPDDTLIEQFVPGEMAGDYIEKESSDALREARKEGATGWTAEAAASDARDEATDELMHSTEGYKIGLLDYLISNSDRHDQNWMVTPDHKPVPIDMGFAQFDGDNYGSPFTEALMSDEYEPYKMDQDEWNELSAKLTSLAPEFRRLGRITWYDNMMQQMASLNPSIPADPYQYGEYAATISAQVLELRFDVDQLRDDKGRWTKMPGVGAEKPERINVPPSAKTKRRDRPVITAAEARGNSRPVSYETFQHLAAIGNAWIDRAKRDASPITGLDEHWDQVKHDTYAHAQEPWGGDTIDAHTGKALASDADKYAITVKPAHMHTVSVPEHASYGDYAKAMDQAKEEFRPVLERKSFYLGVFHDDENNRIDIDPVAVVDTPYDVETVGAYTRAIGGAYHFKSGNGYWPPHVAEGASMANEPQPGQPHHWEGPGQWHSYAVSVQEGEPEEGEDGEDEPPTISGQVLQFGFHFDPHQPRDRHGRWTKASPEALFGGLGKAVSHAAGKALGPNDPTLESHPDAQRLAIARDTANRASPVVGQLIGKPETAWNGKVNVFPTGSRGNELAELDWNGDLNLEEQVTAALEQAQHADEPVALPGSFEVMEHEMIHGVVPQGSQGANKRAYQEYSVGQIEEGFTELGAIQHAPEFMDRMGVGDRPSGEAEGYTVRRQAEEIARPDNIKAGNAWGHYEQQTRDAEQWVEQIAKNEGSTDPHRLVELANEINQQGAAGKVRAMARQMAYSVTLNPKLRNNPAFMDQLMTSVEKDIHEQWSVGAADQVSEQLRSNAAARVQQAERELAERGTLAA